MWLDYVHRLLGIVDVSGNILQGVLNIEKGGGTRAQGSEGISNDGLAGKKTSHSNTSIRVSDANDTSPKKQSVSVGNAAHIASTIVKADLCGATLRVTQAKNPTLIGLEGIVAKETESTFIIASKPSPFHRRRRCVKVVPKPNTIFILQVALPHGASLATDAHAPTAASTPYSMEVELFGNQLCNTLPTRATKKYKARKTIEL